MKKYTAEQVRDWLAGKERAHACYQHWSVSLDEEQVRGFKDAIDVLLRERESAKAAVTDEMVEMVVESIQRARDVGTYDTVRKGIRNGLEAVAPMLASARVPNGWSIGETKVTGAQEIGVWLCDGKSLQVIHPGDSTAANLPFYLIKAMLAAAPKPETKE